MHSFNCWAVECLTV